MVSKAATPLSVVVVSYSASVYLCHLDPSCFYYHLQHILCAARFV